jgi:hypothetical protein
MPAAIDRHEFTRLNAEGWTRPQLAAHFGIAERSVTRLRAKLGISGRVGDALAPETLTRIEDMLDDGVSQHEISRTLGVNRETIRAHFPGRGWTRSQGKTFGNEVHRLTLRVEAANYASKAAA